MTDAVTWALTAECECVETLSTQRARAVWKGWHAAFPLRKCRYEPSIVERLLAVTSSLNGRNALRAYHNCASLGLFVLALDELDAWKCQCASPPAIESLEYDLLVTPFDFAWTFATQVKGIPETVSDLCKFVFVDGSAYCPDMDHVLPSIGP